MRVERYSCKAPQRPGKPEETESPEPSGLARAIQDLRFAFIWQIGSNTGGYKKKKIVENIPMNTFFDWISLTISLIVMSS